MSMRDVVDVVARLAAERWGTGAVERQDVAWRHAAPTTSRRSRAARAGRAGHVPAAALARPARAGRSDATGCRSRPASPTGCARRCSSAPSVLALEATIRELGLVTVCEDAGCPNLSECWSDGTATFMVLGERCTRACGFCLVDTRKPLATRRRTNRAGSPRRSIGWNSTTRCSRWSPATISPTAGWPTSPRASRRSATSAAVPRVETLISDAKGDDGSLDCCSTCAPTC